MATEDSFTLSQLTEVTGLRPEVIRAWERRYGFPTPRRTAGGHRRYTRSEVDLLHRAALLVRSGYRAGDAVRQARDRAAGVEPARAAVESSAEGLMHVLVEGPPARALALLRGNELALGFERALEERVLPALRLVGDGWQSGRLSVAQEHVATGLVISWLGSVRAGLPPAGRPEVLVATPAGETHAVAVWALEVLLGRRGVAALALGADVPLESLQRELVARRPQALVLAVARTDTRGEVRSAAAAAAAAGVRVYIGGPGALPVPEGAGALPATLSAAADQLAADLQAPRA